MKSFKKLTFFAVLLSTLGTSLVMADTKALQNQLRILQRRLKTAEYNLKKLEHSRYGKQYIEDAGAKIKREINILDQQIKAVENSIQEAQNA